MLDLLKRWCGALALAVSLCCLVPSAAHAGTKHWDTMITYLKANGETLESARRMAPTTLTKGGFECKVYAGHYVSHCVEEYLLAQKARAVQPRPAAGNAQPELRPTEQPSAKAGNPPSAPKAVSANKKAHEWWKRGKWVLIAALGLIALAVLAVVIVGNNPALGRRIRNWRRGPPTSVTRANLG